jgi:hypothetical protein
LRGIDGGIQNPLNEAFSNTRWSMGLLAAFIPGLILDGIALAAGADLRFPGAVLLFGLLPGLILFVVSRLVKRPDFRAGMVVGAWFTISVGGLCGAMIAAS